MCSLRRPAETSLTAGRQEGRGGGYMQIWTQGMKEWADRWGGSWKRFVAEFSTNQDLGGVPLHCPLHAKVKAERRLWQHLGQHSSHGRRSLTAAGGRLTLKQEQDRSTKEGGACPGGPALPQLWPLGAPALCTSAMELGTQGRTETPTRSHSFLK